MPKGLKSGRKNRITIIIIIIIFRRYFGRLQDVIKQREFPNALHSFTRKLVINPQRVVVPESPIIQNAVFIATAGRPRNGDVY